MNNENICAILLHLNIKIIMKNIIIYFMNSLDTEYLWKLLYFRNQKKYNILKKYYDTYLLHYSLTQLYDNCGIKFKYNMTKIYSIASFKLNQIYLLSHLEILDFDSNLITLPNEIKLLIKLIRLVLSDSNLITLPNEITELTNLKFLNMSFNALYYIPTQISLLKNINTITLTHNNLISLPSEIGLLNKLEILHISDNILVIIPNIQIDSLKEVDIRGNNLMNVINIKNLDCLRINENQMKLIPKNNSNKIFVQKNFLMRKR